VGEVVPFRRSEPDPGESAEAPRKAGALPDEALHSRTRRASPQARALVAEQAAEDQRRYASAAHRASTEKLIAGGKVVPARITIALDICGLDGPEIDEQVGTWHGNPDGDIDRWEQALAVPSPQQVELLATLTECTVAWFYEPLEPGPMLENGPVWMCFSGREGCTQVQPHVITDAGVLLYEGQPREPVDTRTGPLPGMPVPQAPPAGERASKAPTEGRAAPVKRQAAAVVQPTLPTRMPGHLRAELDALFAARRDRH
jgi:hypothetical protein